MIKFTTGVFAALIVAGATSASAANLSIVGTDQAVAPTTLPGNFGTLKDVNGAVDTADAVFGNLFDAGMALTTFDSTASAPWGLEVNPARRLVFTYLGSEAGFTNETASTVGFVSGSAFNNKTSEFKDTFSIDPLAAIVPFFFETSGGGAPKSATNGVSIDDPLKMAFGTVFNSGRSVIAMLGDGIGDTDLDDIVVRVDVVPLPAAVWMLGAGMLGLGALARRRNATA